MNDAEALANEADRLRNDRPFQEAVIAIRKQAVDSLIAVDVIENPNEARKYQAQITAIDLLVTEIAAQITRGKPKSRPPLEGKPANNQP